MCGYVMVPTQKCTTYKVFYNFGIIILTNLLILYKIFYNMLVFEIFIYYLCEARLERIKALLLLLFCQKIGNVFLNRITVN